MLGALGVEPGGSLLALTLEAPTAARFEFMGQPLVPEAEARAQLAAGEALLVLTPGGQVASELDRRLGAELAATADPARQAVLLASLANAGRPDDVPVVLPFAAARSAQVRIAAADALGRTPGRWPPPAPWWPRCGPAHRRRPRRPGARAWPARASPGR